MTDLWPNVTIKSPQACLTSLGHLKLMKWQRVPVTEKKRGRHLPYSIRLLCLMSPDIDIMCHFHSVYSAQCLHSEWVVIRADRFLKLISVKWR